VSSSADPMASVLSVSRRVHCPLQNSHHRRNGSRIRLCFVDPQQLPSPQVRSVFRAPLNPSPAWVNGAGHGPPVSMAMRKSPYMAKSRSSLVAS